MRRPISVAVLALAALAAGAAAAGTASGTIGVSIVLNPPGAGGSPGPTTAGGMSGASSGTGNAPGTCISDTLSEETGAVVHVVCASGEFVSISRRPGRRFVGSHGGAYNGYYFGPAFGAIHRSGSRESAGGAGTITSFRVYSIEEADGPLDMLVSF